jgi:uncharacterized protein (TIGR02453 family)
MMSFSPAALRFFRQLATHNDKAWFEARRADYEDAVREPMRELIVELDARIAPFAPEIGGDPKRSMFRINRDTRFSKDKSPYKTNAGCWLHHRKASRRVGGEAVEGSAGFYFHLEPAKSFVAAGLWMPPRPVLGKLRDVIANDHRSLARAIARLPKRFGGLDDEHTLSRVPRGYPPDHPAAEWLRYQSFVCGRPLTDAQVTSSKLPALLAREFEAMLPLVRWINGALGLGTMPRAARSM